MAIPKLITVRDHIAWSYANVGCAHAALKAGRAKHIATDWMIRAKLFAGLRDGRMAMGSLIDDEREALNEWPACVYCGVAGRLSLDHLLPRAAGGFDAHNLVRACTPCNSSKGDRDLMAWHDRQGRFPRLLILRRYLKLTALVCDAADVLGCLPGDPNLQGLPVRIEGLPTRLPSLAQLRL